MSSHPPYDPGGNQQPTGSIYIRFDQHPNNLIDSLAIPEGFYPGFERIVRLETDGSPSLPHSINYVLPQQEIQRYVCQPEDAIVLPQAVGRAEIIQRQLNGNDASITSSCRENNIEQERVYAEETHLPGNHTTPQQYMTGYNSFNQHRNEQMVSLPPHAPTKVTRHEQPQNSVSASCSETASNINADNNSKFKQCKSSWIKAGYGEEEACKLADRRIFFLNVGNKFKCLICKKDFDMDNEHHTHDCSITGNTRNTQGASLSDEHLGATGYNAPVAQASLLASSRDAGNTSIKATRHQPPPVNNQSGLSSDIPPTLTTATEKQPTQNETDIKALLKMTFGYSEERIEAVKSKYGQKAMVSLDDFMECDKATSINNSASYEGAGLQTSDLFQTALNASVSMAIDQISENRPESMQYESLEARRRSFDNPPWPTSSMQSPDDMAKAGFYYKGKEDEVRCFSCNVLLRRWQVQDNPWYEHARNRPDCRFVLAEKGEEYVKAANKS